MAMRIVKDRSWARRGMSLLWGRELLLDFAQTGEVVSMRKFFEMAAHWPADLPSGGGDLLVVAGLEGCLDCLSPTDAESWLLQDLNSRVLSFQGEYEGQAGLVFWVPEGRRRITMDPASESYSWHCGLPHSKESLPLGRLLWAGAALDVARILDPRAKDQGPDGPAWSGLHLPRIS